uniref:Uncharacterized protein n=1 Tax=Arundo donax TaxID=35708 RepID=A0A0A9EN23_ARUDO
MMHSRVSNRNTTM